MILINLLPHREMARQQARKVFNASVVMAMILGGLIGAAIFLWFQAEIAEQERRNAFLTSEIQNLDNEIKEIRTLQDEITGLKARQEAVENLQADRNLPVHLMNESVRQLPEGMYLKSIKQENMYVQFSGVAQSNERVSEFLRNLSRRSEWVTDPQLIEIVATEVAVNSKQQRRAYNFTVRAQLRRASDVAAAAAVASAVQSAAFKGV
ncbi:MAG: PilN domain-containing protein [Burkholderiaceae bacterium]|jgi:type IV pilus assembly protein PilN|nr:PilN domain-containing protein [Burkholderiaceae bacterium]